MWIFWFLFARLGFWHLLSYFCLWSLLWWLIFSSNLLFSLHTWKYTCWSFSKSFCRHSCFFFLLALYCFEPRISTRFFWITLIILTLFHHYLTLNSRVFFTLITFLYLSGLIFFWIHNLSVFLNVFELKSLY